MAVQIAFPGIYIVEDNSLALSISGRSTAIPVFVGVFAPRVGVPVMECVRIGNWMDFLENFYPQALVARFTVDASPAVTGTKSRKKNPLPPRNRANPLQPYQALRLKKLDWPLAVFHFVIISKMAAAPAMCSAWLKRIMK